MTTAVDSKLVEKLHPRRFTGMSPRMAFLVGGILGQRWATCPRHRTSSGNLSITSDGYLLACEGNCFIGSVEDWERNLTELLQVADLTTEERAEWEALYASKVTDWRAGGNAYAR